MILSLAIRLADRIKGDLASYERSFAARGDAAPAKRFNADERAHAFTK